MAFTRSTYVKWDAGYNTAVPAFNAYSSATDDAATVAGSGYFNEIADFLKVDDLIYVAPTDTASILRVTAVSPDVTVTGL